MAAEGSEALADRATMSGAGEAELANVTEGRDSEAARKEEVIIGQRPSRIAQVYAFLLQRGDEGALRADVRNDLGISHSHLFEISTKLEERGLIEQVRRPQGVRLIPRAPSAPSVVTAAAALLSLTSSEPSTKPTQHRLIRRPKHSRQTVAYAQSIDSIDCAPCVTCPLESRCSIRDEVNPLTCPMLAQWLMNEAGRPRTARDGVF
jgi:hypothetical protein